MVLHLGKIVLLALAALAGLFLHLWYGEPKPLATWDWLDIVAEGGTALLISAWLLLLLKSRPAGPVTNLLFAGLACLFFSFFMDSVDELIALPATASWGGWLESGPMSVGLLLLTGGIFYWHQEQLLLNEQMRNRERVFREHRWFDKLTPLGDAHYLRKQLELCLQEAKQQRQPLSLVMLDMAAFAQVNRDYGLAEGDRLLQVLTQLLLLNLRPHDLLCRLAGDRFVVLMPYTGEREARLLAAELKQAVSSLAYKTSAQGERLELEARTAVLMARGEQAPTLLERLNAVMSQHKTLKAERYG